MVNTIYREMTNKDMSDAEIDVDLNKSVVTKAKQYSFLEKQFDFKNRQLIRNDPLNNELSCPGCLRSEWNKNLLNTDDVKKLFEMFKRLKLGKIDYKSFQQKNALQETITMCFDCEYCFNKRQYAFLKEELDKEKFQLLKNKSFESIDEKIKW